MTTRHTISHAEELYYGNSEQANANGSRRGIQFHPTTYVEFGTPAAIVTDALLKAATSTNLPNAATKTYSYPSAGTAPQDGSLGATGVLDVPRNVVATATHATAVVAMTLVISGFDVYGNAMSEQLAITATGTTKTATGKKAFKTITSIVATSAGNATTNTLTIGFGDTLGFPFLLKEKENTLLMIDGVPQTTLGTVTIADTTSPATNATGDVRGTWLPNTATNGTHSYAALMWNIPVSARAGSASSAYGVTQA